MNELSYEKQFALPMNRKASATCVIPAYKGLTYEQPEITLGKREVELELKRRCVRYAVYLPVSDSAGRGDFVNMDFQGYLDGQPFDDGKIEGFDLQLGSNTFVDGFEEQIMGRSAGETFEVSVVFPEEYPAEELKGKSCTFTITLNEVRHFTAPDPSDEIAQKEGYADLAEMAEAVRQQRMKLHRAKEDEKRKAELLERVIESTQTVISQPLMAFTVERLTRQLEQQLSASHTTMEQHLRRQRMTQAELEETLRQRASKAITKQMVVDGITEREGLEPTAQEIETALEEYLKAAPKAGSRQKSPQMRALMKERISCHKVSDFLLEHAVEV